MDNEGLILTKTQAKIALLLILGIWLVTFFLGAAVNRYYTAKGSDEMTPVPQTEPKTPAPPATAQPQFPADKFYTLALGYENDLKRAESLKKGFESKGLQGVLILPITGNDKMKYRITLGKFIDKKDAMKARNEFIENKKVSKDVWVWLYEPGTNSSQEK
jgi:hypothetical protein